MIPKHQDKFGVKEGNCYAACVASILEIPLEDVPNFCAAEGDWVYKMNKWLGGFGFCMYDLELSERGDFDGKLEALFDGTWVIISGKSPRGDFPHATVGRYRIDNEGESHRLEYIHDPHPDGTFLEGPAKWVSFFISVDPSQLIVWNRD